MKRAVLLSCAFAGLALGAGAVVVSMAGSSGPQEEVQSVLAGSGYDSAHQSVENPSTSFGVGQTVYVVFTVDTSAAHATAEMKILDDDVVEDTSLPVSLRKGTHPYEETIVLGGSGTVTIQVSYNGQVQAATQITAR